MCPAYLQSFRLAGQPLFQIQDAGCQSLLFGTFCLDCSDNGFTFYCLQFNERGRAIEECKLKVLYVLPSRQQSSISDRPGQGSSLNRSILQERNLSGSQVVHFSRFFSTNLNKVIDWQILGVKTLPHSLQLHYFWCFCIYAFIYLLSVYLEGSISYFNPMHYVTYVW